MRVIALALALLLTGAAPPSPPSPTSSTPPSSASAADPPAVTLTSVGGHVFTEVRLDGSAPLRFAVDTSGGEIVDQAVAERLGLPLGRRVTLSGVGGHSETGRRLTVERVELGAARLDGVRFVALPIERSFGVAEGVHVDGIIGPALLAHFTVTIDAAGGTMTLAPRGSGPLGDLPLALDASGHPAAPCTVAGLPARCQLDTGSRLAVTLLRPFLDAHPAVAARATTADGVQGYGIGGPSRGKLGPVDVTLGGRTVSAIGDYTTQRSGAFADGSVAANVGEPLLRRFVVTYDLARGRVRIVPSAAIDEPQVLDRSGLFLIRPDPASTVVLDVRPGTPAANAGVRANDALVALDGAPTAALSLEEIRARLSAPDGSQVVLRLRGAQGERDVALTLANYAYATRAALNPRSARVRSMLR